MSRTLLEVFANDPGPTEESGLTMKHETTEQWSRRVAEAYPELNNYTRSQLVAELCRREFDRGTAKRADRIERAVFDDAADGTTLADILAAAERDAYRGALTRHGGSIKAAAAELGVDRKTASRAVERLGLRAWLDAEYKYRDPATVGRRGDVRKRRA